MLCNLEVLFVFQTHLFNLVSWHAIKLIKILACQKSCQHNAICQT